jgi:tRNA threonylcarbamoyladenosine biosynthesis protein TsaE
MFDLVSESDTAALGAALAVPARRGDVIALSGPLGAGKTTLARGFIQKLVGADEEVVSPTFTLVQVYDTGAIPIWHFDLYRLEKAEEVFELGFEEALATAITVIEWPERLAALLPAARLDVTLSAAGTGRRAELVYRGVGESPWRTVRL